MAKSRAIFADGIRCQVSTTLYNVPENTAVSTYRRLARKGAGSRSHPSRWDAFACCLLLLFRLTLFYCLFRGDIDIAHVPAGFTVKCSRDLMCRILEDLFMNITGFRSFANRNGNMNNGGETGWGWKHTHALPHCR